MTKIRCGNKIGIDINQVVAWSKAQTRLSSKHGEVLFLYLASSDKPISIVQDEIGCQAFEYLHKLLLDLFAIDLAAGEDDISEDDTSLVDELEDLPY